MALSDIYILRLLQTWGIGGRPMENVFFYEHTAGGGDATLLAETFEAVMLPKINDLQWDGVINIAANVINMGTPSDFAYLTYTGEGNNPDDALPPTAALNFTMKLNTRAVRKGSKRFSGIPESVQAHGVLTNGTYIAKMEVLRLALFAELVNDLDTFLPIVVKRVREEVVGTVPQQYTYRLPITDGELVTGEVVEVVTSNNISHQVSRSL